jgi:phage tail sheath protein FI
MAAWAYGEGVVIGVAGPSGETIAQAQISKANAGVDDWSLKVILGDYVYWNDPVNGVTRLVTPQAWWAGRRATLAPNDSSLNKPLVGVAGTAHSGQVTSGSLAQYTLADIQNCVNSGIDLICNPLPGGAYWGFRVGHNSSSDGKRNGENYSFMTMFLAKSINASMGSYVGKPISPTMVNNAFADLSTFGSNLVTLGIIGTLDGSPAFQVTCGASNNPSTLTGKGYLQGAMVVTYQGINEEFVISLDGGATVSVG